MVVKSGTVLAYGGEQEGLIGRLTGIFNLNGTVGTTLDGSVGITLEGSQRTILDGIVGATLDVGLGELSIMYSGIGNGVGMLCGIGDR